MTKRKSRAPTAKNDVSVPAISQHLKRIYADNELEREATVKQYLMVQTEGDREVQRRVAT